MTLNTAELVFRRALSRADASPFLAHCDLGEEQKQKYLGAFIRYIQGDHTRIPESLRRWPLTAVWAIAISLSDGYGADSGPDVYGVIEDCLGAHLTGSARLDTILKFRAVCRKFGLCFEGGDRYVNDYLAQAGIAKSQLHHVAHAFLAAERSFGPVPADKTAAINSWEDDAVAFFHPGVRIPRMVLEVDETAYYGGLFARYRAKEPSRNVVEQAFFTALGEAEDKRGGKGTVQGVPLPRIIWHHGSLALELPMVEGRINLTVNGAMRRVRGGQDWSLPLPWPRSLGYAVGDIKHTLPVLPSTTCILAFDGVTGRLLNTIEPRHGVEQELDARHVYLVSPTAFNVNQEPAIPVQSNGFVHYAELGSSALLINAGLVSFSLRAKPKPRLWVEHGPIARGAKGILVNTQSRLGIECRGLEDAALDLAVTLDGQTRLIPLGAEEEQFWTIGDLAGEHRDGADVIALDVQLRLRGSERSLYKMKLWLWRGLVEVRDGAIFAVPRQPANFCPARSRHVFADQAGNLCLDTEAAYERATLAFTTSAEPVTFDVPRPGITITRVSADGSAALLRLGVNIDIREDDKAGFLRIRSPDRKAGLIIKGRPEPRAFWTSATRIVAMTELMAPASQNDIVYVGANGHRQCLAQIVPATAPTTFSATLRSALMHIRLATHTPIDAVRLDVEDALGGTQSFECAIMHRPVDGRRPAWLHAELDASDTRFITIDIDQTRYEGPVALALFSVREQNGDAFQPLKNGRGDLYGLVVEPRYNRVNTGDDNPMTKKARFARLNDWIGLCYARECWDDLLKPVLLPRWTRMGEELSTSPGGARTLLDAAYAPRSSHCARTWVPLAHPLQLEPNLYGAATGAFAVLDGKDADGADHLALLGATAGRSISDLHCSMGIANAFLTAFNNFQYAGRWGGPMTGFSFEKYAAAFAAEHTDRGARWFWRPGHRLLGPDHYGAALGRLTDRLFDAGLDEEGANDYRFRQATSVAALVARQRHAVLPIEVDEDETHALVEWAPAFFAAFAQQCRQGTADYFIQQLARSANRPYRSLIGDIAFLIRLAPELLAFYLILWELAREDRTA